MNKNEIQHQQTFSVRLNYCGGCNPKIDRNKIVTRLRCLLQMSEYDIQFVTTRDSADALLLINGCIHACLDEKMIGSKWNAQKSISVQGERIDYQPVLEENLARLVWEKIRVIYTNTCWRKDAENFSHWSSWRDRFGFGC
jgi:hypothetical protein